MCMTLMQITVYFKKQELLISEGIYEFPLDICKHTYIYIHVCIENNVYNYVFLKYTYFNILQ